MLRAQSFRLIRKASILFLIALAVLLLADLHLPTVIGTKRFDVGKKFLVNGKEYQFTFLDGMLLEDGSFSVKVDGKDYKITIDTTPPEGRISALTEGFSFVSDTPVRFYNPKDRGGKPIAFGNEYRLRNEPLLVTLEDEAGNVADALCTSPLLEKLDILDSQGPLTNISGRKFLLASRSPYRLIGRSLVPDNSAIILEDGAVVQHTLNSTLIIKGLFYSIGKVTILGTGELQVTDKGMLYLSGQANDTNVSSDGGALVCLNEVSVGNVNLNYTNYVVLRKINAPYVRISSSYTVYVVDSNIQTLEIDNCATVHINNSFIRTMNVSTMSNVNVYSSRFESINISDLSVLNFVRSTVGKLNTGRGSISKLKLSTVDEFHIFDYGIGYIFRTKAGKTVQTNGRLYNVK